MLGVEESKVCQQPCSLEVTNAIKIISTPLYLESDFQIKKTKVQRNILLFPM